MRDVIPPTRLVPTKKPNKKLPFTVVKVILLKASMTMASSKGEKGQTEDERC
jgi:hypothetical protein